MSAWWTPTSRRRGNEQAAQLLCPRSLPARHLPSRSRPPSVVLARRAGARPGGRQVSAVRGTLTVRPTLEFRNCRVVCVPPHPPKTTLWEEIQSSSIRRPAAHAWSCEGAPPGAEREDPSSRQGRRPPAEGRLPATPGFAAPLASASPPASCRATPGGPEPCGQMAAAVRGAGEAWAAAWGGQAPELWEGGRPEGPGAEIKPWAARTEAGVTGETGLTIKDGRGTVEGTAAAAAAEEERRGEEPGRRRRDPQPLV